MQYINLDSIQQLAGNNTNFTLEAIDIFIEETPAQIDKMNEALKLKNYSAIEKTAHKIKPNVRLFGISPLESIMQDIEQVAKEEPAEDELGKLLDKAEQICNKAVNELQTIKKDIIE